MDTNKLAHTIETLRKSIASPFITVNQLREAIGDDDAYAEAFRLRWITPDYETGNVVLNNFGTISEEIKAAAAEHEKTKDVECTKCKSKRSNCKCKKCEDCGEITCKCPSHTNESRQFIIKEEATLGLGNTDGNSAPTLGVGATSKAPATPAAPVAPAPTPTAPATPGAKLAVGTDATVVENGKTYTGKVKSVSADGKYTLEFTGEKPSTSKVYEAGEIATAPAKA